MINFLIGFYDDGDFGDEIGGLLSDFGRFVVETL